MTFLKSIILFIFLFTFVTGCKNGLPGSDARKISYDPKERVKKILKKEKVFV